MKRSEHEALLALARRHLAESHEAYDRWFKPSGIYSIFAEIWAAQEQAVTLLEQLPRHDPLEEDAVEPVAP